MGKKIRTEEVDHLFEAILCLKNKEECYTFFEDGIDGFVHQIRSGISITEHIEDLLLFFFALAGQPLNTQCHHPYTAGSSMWTSDSVKNFAAVIIWIPVA